ncbi:MAG: ATP-binding protein [Sphingomonadales bacterium]|jgi:signal transduction histidine kinase
MPRAGLSVWRPRGIVQRLAGLTPRTTTSRISLVVFIMLLSGSALLLILLERATYTLIDREAQARVQAIVDIADTAWRREGIEAAVTILDGELQVPGPLVIHLANRDGTLLLGNVKRWPANVPVDGSFYRVRAMQAEHNDPVPYLVMARTMPAGYRLLVGRSLSAEIKLQDALNRMLIAALPLAAILAFLSSRLITAIIADRARGIADVVGEVTAGKLDARVQLPPGPPADAFDGMGQAFNTMLARVEALIDELRTITDGLAHDLRSPLTRLKARTDRLGLGHVVDAADLAAVSAEAAALLGMLDNSLEISRAEAGIGRDSFASVDLSAMVVDLAEMYEPLAEDAGVELRVKPNLSRITAMAHRQLLGRAIANLIDNALRYGGSGKVIELSAEKTRDGTRLTVGDHGPGIPAGQRREALRRFGRLDAARGRQGKAQGAGLGLSLAAAVARLHGGSITLADNQPGLKVIMDLPAVPAAE